MASIAAICGQSFAKVNDDYVQPLSLFMIYSGLPGSNKSSAISIQKTSFSEMEIFCRIVTEPTTSAFSENQMVSNEKYTPTSSSSSVEHDTVSTKMSRSAINSSKIFLNLIYKNQLWAYNKCICMQVPGCNSREAVLLFKARQIHAYFELIFLENNIKLIHFAIIV
jgi:hypothetical protein